MKTQESNLLVFIRFGFGTWSGFFLPENCTFFYWEKRVCRVNFYPNVDVESFQENENGNIHSYFF